MDRCVHRKIQAWFARILSSGELFSGQSRGPCLQVFSDTPSDRRPLLRLSFLSRDPIPDQLAR
jgi:hypothetical protein